MKRRDGMKQEKQSGKAIAIVFATVLFFFCQVVLQKN